MTGSTAQGPGRWQAMRDRRAARAAGRARLTTGFVSQPEPRTIGSHARGRQLVQGNFLFAGFLVEDRNAAIWDLPVPDAAFEAALHGCTWLDDLSAVGDIAARIRAQDWVFGWITRFGAGEGPGWAPDLTARRLIRWINHAILLLNGRRREDSDAFFRSLAQQTVFLSKGWKSASPGLPRFEALTGLIHAGLALTGMEPLVPPAISALSGEAARGIDAGGGIATRNPEDLLEVLTLLNWAREALEGAGRIPAPEHLSAIARIAPTLRALRHADGGLARFHDGGGGRDGRLDAALVASGIRGLCADPAMGFSRLQGGRATVIVDAAAPPAGPASANAHASTLAFEMTSGRCPLVVSCGSGAHFGRDWHRAGRASASHSTLTIEGYSSSRLGPETSFGRAPQNLLETVPRNVWRQEGSGDQPGTLYGHDGYAPTHGLTHLRALDLAPNGRKLTGEDVIGAMTPQDGRQFDLTLERGGLKGIGFQIRFHLHPDAGTTLDMGGHAVSVTLRSGEKWVFRYDGEVMLSLAPSACLEKGRLGPRPSHQIVLSGRLFDRSARIGWTFSQAQDTPTAIAEPETDDPAPDPARRTAAP